MSGWLKVGSHPEKELIIFTDGKRVVSGWFDPSNNEWPWVFNDQVDFYIVGCCDREDEDLIKMNAFMAGSITHWMPFPEPPND